MNLEETLGSMDEKPKEDNQSGMPDFSSGGDESAEAAPVGGPKKPSINYNTLLLIGLLAAVGGGTYLMCVRAAAQAAPANAAASHAESTVKEWQAAGSQNLRKTILMLHDTEQVVKQFDSYPLTTQIPLEDLRTNSFLTSGSGGLSSAVVSEDPSKRLAEQQKLAAEELVSGLRLESLVVGSHSVCMINGKTYHEGQGTDSFSVEQITPEGVWVRIGGVRAIIKMAPPKLD